MRSAPPRDDDETRLFDGGPPLRLLRLWGRFDPRHRRVAPRAAAVAAVGWLPLLALALLSLAGGEHRVWTAFVQDASVHARSLLVAPLLVLAEGMCIPRLGALARTFRHRPLVHSAHAQAYAEVVASVRRLRDTWSAEAVAVVAAYACALLIVREVPASFLPDWHQGAPGTPHGRSLASWWHALVTLPMLLVLLLGWGWRLFLWSRFLWCVSRLRLRLIAAHPEGAAGMMFVGHSLRAFSPIGLAIGIIVAATTLAHVWAGAPGSTELLGRSALATVGVVLLVFVAPLTVFCLPLLRTWRHAISTYGRLAQRVGEAFEDKWMNTQGRAPPAAPLDTGDFSAVTDLYQTVQNACRMRLLPVDLASLLFLAAATALPFGVVALALLPFDEALGALVKLFL